MEVCAGEGRGPLLIAHNISCISFAAALPCPAGLHQKAPRARLALHVTGSQVGMVLLEARSVKTLAVLAAFPADGSTAKAGA